MTKRIVALEVTLAVIIIGATASITQLVPLLQDRTVSLNLGATMAQALEQADINVDNEFRYVHVKFENNLQLADEQFGGETTSDMKIWGYQRSARLDAQVTNVEEGSHQLNMLIMADTGIGCMGFDQHYECEDWPEINMEPLTDNTTLTINDVRVDDKVISFWTNKPLPGNTEVDFSIASSGYSDAGTGLELGMTDKQKHHYIINLHEMVPLVAENDVDTNTVQFQLEAVQEQRIPALESAVFEWNQTTNVVQQLTAADLATAQQAYTEIIKVQRAAEPSMMDNFLNDGPFSIIKRLQNEAVDLNVPVEQSSIHYNGKLVKRVMYAFPVEYEQSNLERYVEIILDPTTETIFEYTLLDERKGMVSRVTFLENKIVTDIDPETFFTEEVWKTELGLVAGTPEPMLSTVPASENVEIQNVQTASNEILLPD